MAPTESEILSNYLIQPSSLTSIITFEQFQSYFPIQLHDSPQLRSLFRDIRSQREVVLAEVAENNEREVQRGNAMRKEVIKTKREAAAAAAEDFDGEIELERALFGEQAGAPKAKHTLTSIVPELDGVVEALQAEIQQLNEQEARLREGVQQTIGALSDLRYGKFANTQIREETVDGLASLQETCDRKT